ncbi:alpha/beta fold hydrolase [Bacillus cytotoxicus]|uniref:alpha/beta fold hydrolase n=1 Tax=Bacillus cytotoxicus TaxID=580165 RepID=UPI0008644DDF|nr:alpha/beta hydrolase [Bacillus cytotoxicus]AWC29949.1 alpha/beta hydrolase [Bacillus cytotoxicus]AWC42085.1 alpha/beta hydrolase [Bacillus cytotoxicus]AWC50016.1 alpha/beta hydrolase [Bacillus cytotoxicus]AWC54072.1 alpha/beta hydrolase [Bacillus cytotoxicus]AWC58197.1 alpha/beta hydrolase [Bacillus cytotoxicus]
METFVLVHGAWDGSYVWGKVAALLRKDGHRVYTPTLTGLGERTHLMQPSIGLNTYIQDIVNVIRYEELKDVILVGHSYSGMVITGVAEVIPEFIKKMVYVDAMIPDDGDSVMDISGSKMAAHFIEEVKAYGEGWRVLPRNTFDERKSAMSLLAFTQAVEIKNPIVQHIPHIYVEIQDHPEYWPMTPIFLASAKKARDRKWNVFSIEAGGHWIMETNPEALVHILNKCVE